MNKKIKMLVLLVGVLGCTKMEAMNLMSDQFYGITSKQQAPVEFVVDSQKTKTKDLQSTITQAPSISDQFYGITSEKQALVESNKQADPDFEKKIDTLYQKATGIENHYRTKQAKPRSKSIEKRPPVQLDAIDESHLAATQKNNRPTKVTPQDQAAYDEAVFSLNLLNRMPLNTLKTLSHEDQLEYTDRKALVIGHVSALRLYYGQELLEKNLNKTQK